MKKLKCINTYLVLLLLATFSANAQNSLYVANSSSITIKTGTIFSIDSLSLTPSADFAITGNNEVTKSANPYHPINRMYIQRVFHALATLKPFNGDITIYYLDSELDNLDEGNLHLAINEDIGSVNNGANWNIYTNNITRDNVRNFVTTTGITNVKLNEATLVDPNAVLPLTFTLFNAACMGNGVLLTWKTEQEHSIKKFDLEKSVSGNDWKITESVEATAQSGLVHSYSVKDNNLFTGSLYRVAEYDLDGRKTYSSIIRASCSEAEGFNIYPNPIHNIALVNIKVNNATTVIIQLTDSKGSVVKHLQSNLLVGTNQLQFNMMGIAKGYYNLTAYWGNQVKVVRVIKE